MENEIFLEIKDYENLYYISNFGNTKSLLKIRPCGKHKFVDRIYEEKILKNFIDKRGYIYITLSKDGVSKRYLLHRLIAESFIENKNNFGKIKTIYLFRSVQRSGYHAILNWVSKQIGKDSFFINNYSSEKNKIENYIDFLYLNGNKIKNISNEISVENGIISIENKEINYENDLIKKYFLINYF